MMQNTQLEISKSESSFLSLLRVMSMFSIVICHILQTLDNNWAWVFNIGVQVFLALSGYLYGHKVIDKWIPWFIGRFKKLYIPYFVFIIFIMLLYTITGFYEVTIKDVAVYMFGLQVLTGGGIDVFNHLWFLSAIALCYLITPLLQKISKYSTVCVLFLFLLCIIQYYIYPLHANFFSWFYLYSIGYFLPRLKKPMKCLLMLSTVIMLIEAMIGISWLDIREEAIQGTIMHNCIGLLILFLFTEIGSRVEHSIMCGVIVFLDALSYYIYIVHAVFVCPPHVVHITDSCLINIIVALVFTITAAFILKYISNKISSAIPVLSSTTNNK